MIEIGENPANWVFRVLSLDKLGDLADAYRDSEQFQILEQELDRIKANPDPELEIKFDSEYAVSTNRRQELVNSRLRTIYWRSPAYNMTRLSVSAIIAFVLGSVFLLEWNPKTFTENQMRARLSAVFLSFIITGIMAIVSVLPVMTMIRDMYYRHHDAGMYGSLAMGLALGVAEKWFILLAGAIFTAVFLSTSHIGEGAFSVGFWVSGLMIDAFPLLCFVPSDSVNSPVTLGFLYV